MYSEYKVRCVGWVSHYRAGSLICKKIVIIKTYKLCVYIIHKTVLYSIVFMQCES